jgi:hypothetical protein
VEICQQLHMKAMKPACNMRVEICQQLHIKDQMQLSNHMENIHNSLENS